jgi:hypothetical protein
VDIGTGQLDVLHHDPAQVDGAEAGAGQVNGTELRAAEVNVLEPGAMQIGTDEVSHTATLTSRAKPWYRRSSRAARRPGS